jgi:hypothetical protein
MVISTTKIFNLGNLLGREYFPAELPPCFTSVKFSKLHSALCTQFISADPPAYGEKHSSSPLVYFGFKTEKARRKFSIPNPYHYLLIANELVSKQNDLIIIFQKSDFSLTKPNIKSNDDKAFSRVSNSIKETRNFHEGKYKANTVMIRLDISSFF